jgi:hypothetical protein
MECTQGFVGDPSQPVVARPFILDVSSDGTSVTRMDLADGGASPLIIPTQGGFVVFAGLALKNVDSCNVTMSGEYLDASGQMVLSNRDTRQTRLDLSPTADGYYLPADLDTLSTVPNVPLCPDLLGVNIADTPAILKLTATDKNGRTITTMTKSAPSCTHPDTKGFCECVCGANYQPGKCASDGGV